MTNPRAASGDGDKDSVMAKTAGFIVFSGIAISVLKTLIPRNRAKPETESARPIRDTPAPPPPPRPQEPIYEKPITCMEQNVVESVRGAVVIKKGDTLWGLSRKYGVSIDAIKEANGLTSNTIYTGKKIVIP